MKQFRDILNIIINDSFPNLKKKKIYIFESKFSKLKGMALRPLPWLNLIILNREVRDKDIEYKTGLAGYVPEGYVGLLFPRSSVSNTGLMLANAVGVVDSQFFGEIRLRFKDVNRHLPAYNVGDRVGQLVLVPIITTTPEFVDELPNSSRGSGGFGSSGK